MELAQDEPTTRLDNWYAGNRCLLNWSMPSAFANRSICSFVGSRCDDRYLNDSGSATENTS